MCVCVCVLGVHVCVCVCVCVCVYLLHNVATGYVTVHNSSRHNADEWGKVL